MNVLIERNSALPSFAEAASQFDMMARMADVLSESSLFPDTLTHDKPKDKGGELLPKERRVANAMLIVNQARQWDIDPMALAQGVSVVYGKLMYEGKVIAGVVNSRAGLMAPLSYDFSGEGDNRKCTVRGTLASDPHNERSIEVVLFRVRTQNDMWKKDPDTMLTYRGAREWARRHVPGLLLGVVEDQTEVKLALADHHETATSSTKVPDEVIEDDFRQQIANVIAVSQVEHVIGLIRSDNVLAEHRKGRLIDYALQRIADMFSRDIERLDFSNQEAVNRLIGEIREAQLTDADRESLRALFAKRRDELTKQTAEENPRDRYISRISGVKSQGSIEVILEAVELDESLSREDRDAIVDAAGKRFNELS